MISNCVCICMLQVVFVLVCGGNIEEILFAWTDEFLYL